MDSPRISTRINSKASEFENRLRRPPDEFIFLSPTPIIESARSQAPSTGAFRDGWSWMEGNKEFETGFYLLRYARVHSRSLRFGTEKIEQIGGGGFGDWRWFGIIVRESEGSD